jgi:hypothetical protein
MKVEVEVVFESKDAGGVVGSNLGGWASGRVFSSVPSSTSVPTRDKELRVPRSNNVLSSSISTLLSIINKVYLSLILKNEFVCKSKY